MYTYIILQDRYSDQIFANAKYQHVFMFLQYILQLLRAEFI